MKKKASKKKVKPEQQVGNLFAGLFDEPKEENGLQRNDDAVRTEAVPTDNRGQQQGLRGGESTTRKAAAQEVEDLTEDEEDKALAQIGLSPLDFMD